MVSANDNRRSRGRVAAGDPPKPDERKALGRVTDDMPERINVLPGEAQLLGSLIDAVIDKLRATVANDP